MKLELKQRRKKQYMHAGDPSYHLQDLYFTIRFNDVLKQLLEYTYIHDLHPKLLNKEYMNERN
jgi:hypothetical protein